MDVSTGVRKALEGLAEDWRTALALTLAAELDGKEPNAAMARELRSLMASIEESKPAEKGNAASEFIARRARRIAEASG